jgi:Domain of unknown function (DUF6458)
MGASVASCIAMPPTQAQDPGASSAQKITPGSRRRPGWDPSPFLGAGGPLSGVLEQQWQKQLWERRSFRADRPGHVPDMTIGTSIFLIAVGAILAFAVDATVAGFSIQTAGVILMLAGVVGLLIGLFLLNSRRTRTADRTVYDDRAGRTVYEDRPL